MNIHEQYMQRCLELAAKGLGHTAPNPMVGCVIVHAGSIIGEGYHQKYGEAHAEVNAVYAVADKELLKQATLYVNLEPCSHFGKTPPCADLILQYKIPYVVIGSVDSNPLVKGKGIEKLIKAGVDVKTGVLENECRALNKRFFTSIEKKRPYIILKWAQTADGFIDAERNYGDGKVALQISNTASQKLAHQWRSEEQAIMVGTNTALLDDPKLTVRHSGGSNPVRILLDRELKVPVVSNIYNKDAQTFVFTSKEKAGIDKAEFICIDFNNEEKIIPQVLKHLHERNIRSLIVEGGTKLLSSFLKAGLWDEARVFVATKKIGSGIRAPETDFPSSITHQIADDTLQFFFPLFPKNI